MLMRFSVAALIFTGLYLAVPDPVGKSVFKAFAIGCASVAALIYLGTYLRNKGGK